MQVGTIIFPVYVGAITPAKLDEYLDRFKASASDWVAQCEENGFSVFFYPVRSQTEASEIRTIQFKQLPKITNE